MRTPEKSCPMCGRRMQLIEERPRLAESEHAPQRVQPVLRYWACSNSACEHVQRAA